LSEPVVSVILTHQLEENLPYLQLALDSVLLSQGIEFEVFLVSGQKDKPPAIEHQSKNLQIIWDPQLDIATKKINYALSKISTHSTHLMLLSDDVILSWNSLSRMYNAFLGRELIIGPMSNSDFNSRYEASIELQFPKIYLRPDMSLQDLKLNHLDDLLNVKLFDDSLGRLLIPFPWISFYCVMMPKSVWQKVGGLDEKLEYRYNDQDFCTRAQQLGIPTVVNFAAFAFHFGSRTMKHLKTPQIDQAATEHFMKKWSLR